ncbi:MAG: hypothetical protein RPU52_02500 [Candidatus Sedimenticola sp. (ex Thyasira tokunagai)]
MVKSQTGSPAYTQGYWARSEGRPRKPPEWHKEHKDEDWINDWITGWDEKNERIKKAEDE